MLKGALRSLFSACGYDLRRIRTVPAGSDTRPIGILSSFLEDVRARGFAIDCAVDCGANEGDWAREFLAVYPHAKLVLVEAQESMRGKLEAIKAVFPETRVHIGGVGREHAEKLFTFWPDGKGSTFLQGEDGQARAEGRQVPTAIDTLPDILRMAGASVPQLVKMDIQGFELEALEGMGTMLKQVGALILESDLYSFLPGQPQADALVTWLAARGFFIYDVCGYGRRPSDGAVSHLDFVFANDNGPLRKNKAW